MIVDNPKFGDLIVNGNGEIDPNFALYLEALTEAVNETQVESYAVADLPDVTAATRIVYVTDEVDGPTLAFNDGTDWRRVQDRAVVTT